MQYFDLSNLETKLKSAQQTNLRGLKANYNKGSQMLIRKKMHFSNIMIHVLQKLLRFPWLHKTDQAAEISYLKNQLKDLKGGKLRFGLIWDQE